jgi:hypothetical protein
MGIPTSQYLRSMQILDHTGGDPYSNAHLALPPVRTGTRYRRTAHISSRTVWVAQEVSHLLRCIPCHGRLSLSLSLDTHTHTLSLSLAQPGQSGRGWLALSLVCGGTGGKKRGEGGGDGRTPQNARFRQNASGDAVLKRTRQHFPSLCSPALCWTCIFCLGIGRAQLQNARHFGNLSLLQL